MGGRRRVGGKADFKAEWGAVGMRPGADGEEGVEKGKDLIMCVHVGLFVQQSLAHVKLSLIGGIHQRSPLVLSCGSRSSAEGLNGTEVVGGIGLQPNATTHPI